MHAFVYVCMHVCMHACIHTYIHTHTDRHTYMHTCRQSCTPGRVCRNHVTHRDCVSTTCDSVTATRCCTIRATSIFFRWARCCVASCRSLLVGSVRSLFTGFPLDTQAPPRPGAPYPTFACVSCLLGPGGPRCGRGVEVFEICSQQRLFFHEVVGPKSRDRKAKVNRQ